ncbi:MAG: DUF444 family protein, partial [Bdellovibrionales bacterium]|nr:DUF444 family protein [Bdellovibrionales bacterium]
VEQILVERVRRMIQNGQQPKTQNGKLMIPVLPPIPYFELDRNVLSILTAKKPPAPIDGGVYDPQQDTGYGQDDNSLLLQSGFLPGEVFWWNGQGQGGDGNGDGDGDGKGDGNGKGRPKKPNGGKSGTGTPDNSPGTPGSVGNGGGEVPIEQAFWGEMLGDTLKLPNIRRTNGESEELTRVRRGSVRKPKGYELDELTLANAMEKAIALRKKRGLPFRIGEFDPSTGEVLNKRKLIREAIPLMDQGDIQVSYFTETPRPDFEAVMVVMGDMTGSMSGLRIELAKQLIFNIQALLKAGYKKITIRYVGFAMNAIEMSEDEFFNSFISGGTSYQSALLKGQEILNEYSNSTHNKYMLLVGDGESFDAHQSANIIRSLYEDLQFFSFAVTSGGHLWAGDFVRTIS